MRVVIVEGEGAVLGVNLGRSIVTNRDFATQLFPNYCGQDLLFLPHVIPGPPILSYIYFLRLGRVGFLHSVCHARCSPNNVKALNAFSCLHTMFRKNTLCLIFGHKFCKCRPIFKILSLTYSQVRISHHLNYTAVLPCEIEKINML